MKKIFMALMLCSTIAAGAQTTSRTVTTTHHRYYYYAPSNIYYDDETGSYWYYDGKSDSWIMAKTLPSNYTAVKGKKYPIMYEGDDPWKNNAADVKKYKVKGRKAKIKTDDTKYKTTYDN